ncbi:MAG TPA: NTP transferase domain-containing protein [Bacteroidia bacterium]|nr:NTP transferase domain-containing protein [Bacteroidia bacterium]HNU32943.1 NTP transferase domain-containing protein [Bacteroidia bacterium]
MNDNILILAQPVRSGKTSQLMRWTYGNEEEIRGVITPDFSGKRILVDAFSSNTYSFEIEDDSLSFKIGNFKLSKVTFSVAENILSDAMASNCDWIVIDEIGKLELFQNTGFEPCASKIIAHFLKTDTAGKKLLLVVRDSLLQEAISHYKLQNVRVIGAKDLIIPPKKRTGIVLCGGKSSRMKQDKSMLIYHSKPQRYHVYDLLKKYCSEVFISVNDVSQVVESDGYSYLIDDKKNIGPVAGLIRACKANPKTDVIIVGCDYPHLNDEMLKKLIQSNDESFLASAFFNSTENCYEPLLAIYKSECLPFLNYSVENNQNSLQKFLNAVNAHKVYPSSNQQIKSVDIIEEFMSVNEKIKKGGRSN